MIVAMVAPSARVKLRFSLDKGHCHCALGIEHGVALRVTPTPSTSQASQAPSTQLRRLLSHDSDDGNGPECAICMREIAFSCVGGCCTHHYCAACLLAFSASTRDSHNSARVTHHAGRASTL